MKIGEKIKYLAKIIIRVNIKIIDITIIKR